MADQLSFEELKLFLVSLSNIINRTAAVYYYSDLIGLEICERRLEEHTRVLVAISLSQSDPSLEDFFGVLVDSLAALLRRILTRTAKSLLFPQFL